EPLRAPLRLGRRGRVAVFCGFGSRRRLVARRSFLVAQRCGALDGVSHFRRDRFHLRDDGLGRLGNLFLDRLDDAFVTHRISPFMPAPGKKYIFSKVFGDDISTQRYSSTRMIEGLSAMREKRTSDRITRRGLLSAAGLAGAGMALPRRGVAAEGAKPDPA